MIPSHRHPGAGKKPAPAALAELPQLARVARCVRRERWPKRAKLRSAGVYDSPQSFEQTGAAGRTRGHWSNWERCTASHLGHIAAGDDEAERSAARNSSVSMRGTDVDRAVMDDIANADPKVKLELIRAAGERGVTAATAALLEDGP